MALIWSFLLAMLSVSGVIWGLSTLFRFADKRVEQWPALWSVGLSLCVAIPFLGLLLLLLPNPGSYDALAVFSLHEPLQSMGLLSDESQTGAGELYVWNMTTVMKGVCAIYSLGVFLCLMKLAIGRYRLHEIIHKADCADIAGQDDVLVSPHVQSPFAWTPFGQPKHSRIIVPESYRGVVSEADLLNILIHERAHITRRDDESGLVLRVLLCLCWMSPFAHRLFAQWSQATEIRCDMAVTAHRDPDMRRAYAETLLQALHIAAGRVRQYPAASFSTHRIRNEKMRIRHIMNGTRPSYKRGRDRLLLGLAASIVTGVGMLTVSETASADPSAKKGDWNWVSTDMVSGRLTASFGQSFDPFKDGETRDHYGIDIAAPTGTPIYAPAGGTILHATTLYDGKPKYGTVVVFEAENGIVTLFSHLEGFNVEAGQRVWKGDQLATIGNTGKSTGPHVHIETFKNGTRVDPAIVWDIRTP